MIKKIITFSTIFLLSNAVFAQGGFQGTNTNSYNGGGFNGPSATVSSVTVEQAKKANDDTLVTLRGNIIEQVRKDDYIFKDGTGTILVDIDRDKWVGQTITPETKVEIFGEVDRDWNSVEIDVKSIRVIQ